MPIVFNASWERSVKRLSGGREYCKEALATGITTVIPGTVAVVINKLVYKADQDLNNGSFAGLFFSELSTSLDEISETDAPTLIKGPCTVWVGKAALTGGVTTGFTLNATETVELVVGDDGLLKVRAAEDGPTVAILNDVDTNGIWIELLADSVVYARS